jgi:uncharacterized membrane protein
MNIEIITGIFLMLSATFTSIFPPKFGNIYYGVTTRWTLKNETVWAYGQKLFAISMSVIGLIFFIVGELKLRETILPFSTVLLLIGLWALSKYFVHKILERKYPGI